MAVLHLNYLSKALGLQTNVSVIIPAKPFTFGEAPKHKGKPEYQVLWLLHGGGGDDQDYVNFSNIVRYADENQIAVVMPSDQNAFYTDGFLPNGGNYFTFVTEELVKMCRSIFPFSKKREDNFIAGLSMGSGGAMKCAVLHPELYGGALIMSGGGMRLHRPNDVWAKEFLQKVVSNEDVSDYPDPEDYKRDVNMALPIYNILKEGKTDLPKFWFTCGGDDFLLSDVKLCLDFYEFMGLPLYYEEVPGYKHEWDFWDLTLKKALKEWLPLRHSAIYPEEEA
ncbi:MAG: hypothetical protein IJL98_07715 [Lachnospiraceae bacterium]|nr:hypothetical protein [Lachnospiraceae bacterium]